MNFADILNEWDRRTSGSSAGFANKVPLYRITEEEENPVEHKAAERRRLLRKKPDAVLDLHGLTQDEAWEAMEIFFERCRTMGHEKIVLIHGKGNHSENDGVLRELCRRYIEHCPIAGESGRNSGSMGGSGATWVLLKT